MSDWDRRYRIGDHSGTTPDRLLVEALEALQPGRALDLACGAGRHAVFLAERGWDVTAVDASTVAVEITRRRTQERGLHIDARVADLERNEFVIEPATFDLICDFYYLQRNLFPRIRAGIKSSGAFVAAIHLTSENPSEDKGRNPSFLLKPDELLGEFEGWEVVHYSETHRRHEDAAGSLRRLAEVIAKRPPTP
jgi:SAM-dependent methyltransferase